MIVSNKWIIETFERFQEKIFSIFVFRFLISTFIFLRGTIFFCLSNTYNGTSDYCWLHRVSDIRLFQWISGVKIKKIVRQININGENIILKSFLKSKNAIASKSRYSLSGKGKLDIFRDIIVLKSPSKNERGVLLIKYTPTFDSFLSYFDINEIFKKYYIVLEPSWAGYCDPSILMFISNKSTVVVQCFTDEDYEFIASLQSKMVPIRLGPADWVDSDLFKPMQTRDKKYDLVMVANWGRYKQHKELFKALRRIHDRHVKVLLIGFDWGNRTQYDILREAEIINSDLVHIEIKEMISQEEISQLLRQSKVFLFLSKKEGDNKAIVEAFFCNVPAIVYENAIGGARNRINKMTGIFSSYGELGKNIIYMLDNYKNFLPREWSLQNTGSSIATSILNSFIKKIAILNAEKFTTNIVEKTNSPNLNYKKVSNQVVFKQEYYQIHNMQRDTIVLR